jgi:ankyrin repeat protein
LCVQKQPFEAALLMLVGNCTATGGLTIHDAASAGDAVSVRTIVQTNAAAALLTNNLGETALHLGAAAASPAVVEALLASKAPVNAQAREGTPLHYAIAFGWSSRLGESLGKSGLTNLDMFARDLALAGLPATRERDLSVARRYGLEIQMFF